MLSSELLLEPWQVTTARARALGLHRLGLAADLPVTFVLAKSWVLSWKNSQPNSMAASRYCRAQAWSPVAVSVAGVALPKHSVTCGRPAGKEEELRGGKPIAHFIFLRSTPSA